MITRTSQPASGAMLISEMKEFASFPKATQRYIRRSLDVAYGRRDAIDSAEVDLTFKLFAGIVGDAKEQKGVEKREIYACRQDGAVTDDPHYTIRAWRGVVTYLLRRHEFLYE